MNRRPRGAQRQKKGTLKAEVVIRSSVKGEEPEKANGGFIIHASSFP
jgi:hypothetical protein